MFSSDSPVTYSTDRDCWLEFLQILEHAYFKVVQRYIERHALTRLLYDDVLIVGFNSSTLCYQNSYCNISNYIFFGLLMINLILLVNFCEIYD